MSHSRWRLLSRDIGAAFAFSSLLLSWLLPNWVVFIFGLCWLLSLLGFRPLRKMEFASALLLLAFAVPLFAASILGKMDFVISACCFACLFAAIRMVGRPSESMDAQVNLGALLMMTGGAALTGELWYLLSLGGFAVFTPLSMGMSTLQQHGAKPAKLRPALFRVGMGISLAFIGMSVFFILLPRLSWKISHLPLPQGLEAVSGLADTVKLQSSGNLKTSPRIVARIELTPHPNQPQLNHYWVARYYRDFDGKEWHTPQAEKTTDSQIILPRKNGKKVFQKIELLPAYGSPTLIALDAPFVFFNLQRATTQGHAQISMTEWKDAEVRSTIHTTSLSYETQSFLPDNEGGLLWENTVESLPGAHNMEEGLEAYKRLPEEVDIRIAKLAQEILKTETSPLKAARLIENYLHQNFQYSLQETIGTNNPLAEFLFVKKRGHCEQFATAFAVLLRQGGFASRVVGGFFGGEQLGNRYILRAGDAHAWTQVYDSRLGWVSFDATPPAGRQARPNAFLAWVLEVQETLDAWWQSKVVDYSIREQTKMAHSLLRTKTSSLNLQWKPLALSWQWLWLLVLAFFLYLKIRPRHPAQRFLKQLEKRLQKLQLLNQETPSVDALWVLLPTQNHPLKRQIESAYVHYLRWRFGNIPYEPYTARKLLNSLKLQGTSQRIKLRWPFRP